MPELLAPDQNEHPAPPRLVRQHPKIGSEVGCTLNFIWNGTLLEALQKPSRIGFSEFALIRGFSIHAVAMPECVAAKRGLAGLARPGQGGELKLLEPPGLAGRNLANDRGKDWLAAHETESSACRMPDSFSSNHSETPVAPTGQDGISERRRSIGVAQHWLGARVGTVKRHHAEPLSFLSVGRLLWRNTAEPGAWRDHGRCC